MSNPSFAPNAQPIHVRAMTAGEADGMGWRHDPCMVWPTTAESTWMATDAQIEAGMRLHRLTDDPRRLIHDVAHSPRRFPVYPLGAEAGPGAWTVRADGHGLLLRFPPTSTDAVWLFFVAGDERSLQRVRVRGPAGRVVAVFEATDDGAPPSTPDEPFRFVTLTWRSTELVESVELTFALPVGGRPVHIDTAGLHARERPDGAPLRVDWQPRRAPRAPLRLHLRHPLAHASIGAIVVVASLVVALLVAPREPDVGVAPGALDEDRSTEGLTGDDPAVTLVPYDELVSRTDIRWATFARLLHGDGDWTHEGPIPWPAEPPPVDGAEWSKWPPAWRSEPGEAPDLVALLLDFELSDVPVEAVHVAYARGPLSLVGVIDVTDQENQVELWRRNRTRAAHGALPGRTVRIAVDPPRPVQRLFVLVLRPNGPAGVTIAGVALEPTPSLAP
jgi:hypothetical protein